MPLGWIDFSKTERNKVFSVLDMLSESGTLDELGIAPIRDGFAGLFFPGTSTIQTRAKYFFIVPYALKDLEHSPETNPGKVLRAFDEIERSCGQILLRQNRLESGIIGGRSLRGGRWVKRTPAEIYWAGLRRYGIFAFEGLSLTEYVGASCTTKTQKQTLRRLGNRRDDAEESETDDRDAGNGLYSQFWNMPLYRKDWMDRLEIRLTQEEGAFLKKRIIASCPDSMLAYILKYDRREVSELDSFRALEPLMGTFPARLQTDYALAVDFSDFLLVLRTVYNMIVSQGENADANRLWVEFVPFLHDIALVDLEAIFSRLQITDLRLCSFLSKAQKLMEAEDLDGLKLEIIRREDQLKGPARAKTRHPEQFDHSQWYGGGALDYRFGNAKTILKDIFESEGAPC